MKQEKFKFKNSKGQNLIGLLYSPNKREYPIVIFVHGYRSTKENSKVSALAPVLTKKNISLFAFDFTGRGESDGNFEDTKVTQYIDDLESAIKFCKTKTNKVALIGNSLGGLVSLRTLLRQRNLACAVMIAPVSIAPWKKTGDFSAKNVKEWKSKGFLYTHSARFGDLKIDYGFYEDLKKYKDNKVYKSINIPLLILHGDKDLSVSISHSKKLVKIIKCSKLRIIKNTGHLFDGKDSFEEMISNTVLFLIDNLGDSK